MTKIMTVPWDEIAIFELKRMCMYAFGKYMLISLESTKRVISKFWNKSVDWVTYSIPIGFIILRNDFGLHISIILCIAKNNRWGFNIQNDIIVYIVYSIRW